jgi:hypothetical protein
MKVREWMPPPMKSRRENGCNAIAKEHKSGNAKKTRASCSQAHREIRHPARVECEMKI